MFIKFEGELIPIHSLLEEHRAPGFVTQGAFDNDNVLAT